MRNSLIKSISLVTLLLTMGVGQLWADVWIRGDMNSWSNNDDWKFSDGKLEVYLDANTDYTFKVWDEVGYQNNHYRSYDLQSGKITSTIVKYNLDKDNVDGYNLVLHTAEAGTYIFQYAYEDSKHKLSIYFPRARLEKQKYVYFDARRLTGSNSDYWQRDDFTARFWFKYYDSGSDNGSVDCSKANALEDWVYYALVPDHAYIGQIQLNRIVNNSATCAANIAHAKDRDGTAQNCLKEETGKVDYCNSWTPQWTTYCPIKATSTISDNGTIKTWGGSGTSGSPYYVATGSKIKVSGTSTDNISDANMTTKYDFQVRNTSDVQQAHSDGTGTTYEYTVPATNDVVYKVRVNSYNYYNSTSSTAKWSSDIYYKARTPYTISYNAGTGGSGSRASETKLKGVSFTLPNSAVFERTGYTQTGWTTSDGGSQTHALGGSYTGDSTQTFYPFWTENEYNITIAVSGPGTTSPASSVVGKIETPSVEITATPNTGYKLRDWGFSKTGEDNDVWCADSYSSTDATIKILAKHDGTLTANFIAQTYRVGLDNRAATTPGTGSVNVTYNSTDGLTSAITCPQKTYYTFGGYYISTDGGRTLTNTQLIAANGNWNTNVSGYIDENKKWICAGDTMLYAKWTETLHTITIQSGGNGTVSPASVNVGGVTSSEAITATPNTGYHFRDWTLPAGGIVTTHEKTSSTDATIHIKATGSGSITANFDPTNYTVTLEDKGADEGHKGTSNVSVTYNATTGLTSAITCPEKSHYSFGGYYTSNDGGVTLTNTQLIDANGNWVKNVSGYTGSSGNNPTWIHAGNITLYAKWTETLFTVNVAVSPAEAGSVKVNGSTVSQVTAGFATHSPQLIADSVNALWTFKVWQATSNAHLQTGSYGIYRPTMEITAEAANQTVTAVFQHRYNLLGSKYAINTEKQNQELGGMPGWNYGNGADFTVNSYPGDGDDVTVELVCTRNLVAGTYIFEIHDRATSKSLGRKNGSSIYELGEGQSVELRDGDDQNQSIFFYPQAAGEYTFKITFMRKSGVNYYPTVTILRPQQVHLGWKYENIGGSLSDGNTGGTAEIKKKSDNSDVPNGTWLTYGTAVTYNANPVKGYKVDWYANNDYSTDHITSSYSFDHDGTSTGNGYVKFTELATKVSLENDGHGHVEIGDVTQTETTCGVTTTRSLTAVPNTGYTFHEWSKPSGDDIDFTTNINPTTLRGNGDGLQKGQRVCANFTAKTYTVTLDNDHGNAENNGSATATYASSTLTDKTDATFDGWTVLGYWNNTAVQVINSDGTLIAGVSGYTDGSSNWIYDNNVSLYAHWSRSITLDKNGGTADGSVTMTYKGTAGTPSAPTRANYHVVGYYTEAGCTNKVMEANGTLVNYAGFVEDGKWVHQTASTLYAKWTSPNFVIYRSGDKASDPHALSDAVETYDGGTLDKPIEFRMKVHQLDWWYTLCLPFTVTAVQVWDDEDGAYYDLEPYYRDDSGYHGGYYIIRTPSSTTNFPIANFDDWRDPTYATGWLPSRNTPYIIQWHNSYFSGKYISFFGLTGQTIPSFSAGEAPLSNDVVNVHGNNSMTSGSVTGAYLLEADYGPNGAWLRAENPSASRTILPFECYILVNEPTRTKYRAIRPGMSTGDTPTGSLPVTDNSSAVPRKVLINNQIYIIREGWMYTIQGSLVKEAE